LDPRDDVRRDVIIVLAHFLSLRFLLAVDMDSDV
jgi:hypothetical protein